VRITDDRGSSTQGVIAAGIRWPAEHGARVVNLSWGLALGARSTGQVELDVGWHCVLALR
jgi:subtilisin family serine protease